MKRYITILLLSLLMALPAMAQNMRTLFVGMPDSIIPLLTETNRADCVDFIDAGMRAQVSNRLNGKSELLQLTDDYLKLKMSSHSSLEMKLLPRIEGDTLICIIRSVCAEACNSIVSFYTKEWKECRGDSAYFKYPQIKEFFNAGDSLGKVLDIADIYLVQLSLSPANTDVEATYTMPAYMSKADSAFVSKYLQKIVYRWDGKRFIRR
ncbi:MAG: DUF3256 family protein [Bacteroidaceae bacterium]|nr:DUF3256 family protein [Bacteroidaceae bacterium]